MLKEIYDVTLYHLRPNTDHEIVNKKYVDDAVGGEDIWDRSLISGSQYYIHSHNVGDWLGYSTDRIPKFYSSFIDTSALTVTGFSGIVQASGGVFSASTALADGTTATTQTAGDSSTKVATTKYVDDAIGVENLWDRFATYILPHTATDELGATGARIVKAWLTSLEVTNIPTVNGTPLAISNWNDAYSKRVDNWTSPLQFSSNTASILQSGAAQSGYLSSTDWNTFNNKEPALTKNALTASAPLSLSASVTVIGTGAALSISAATYTDLGAASFSSTDFTVTAGAVTLKAGGTGLYWDRFTTYLLPHTSTDELGDTTHRLQKGWFTDLECTNAPTVSAHAVYYATGTDVALADGGTNASLTAVNGGIVYSGASALAISAAGSVGQLLRSAGAASPVWTTAAYPATASNVGRWLRADGTNWVESTSTLANTYTQYDIVYASAANSLTGLASVASKMLYTDGSKVPTWGTDPPTLTSLTVDNINLNGNTVSSVSGALNLTPVAGSAVVIDSHWSFDSNICKGLTNNDTTFRAYSHKGHVIDSDYIQIKSTDSTYPYVFMTGGNSRGYYYSAYSALADGVNLGYNAYYDVNASAWVVYNAAGRTSRLRYGYGFCNFYCGLNTGDAPTVSIAYIGYSGTVFNEDASDIDFRIEGTGDPYLFDTDAGNNRIGIGTNAPNYKLDVRGVINANGTGGYFRAISEGSWVSTNTEYDILRTNNGVGIWGYKGPSNNYGTMIFKAQALVADGPVEQMRIIVASSYTYGRVGIATTAPDRKLEINDPSGNCLRLTYNDNDGSATYYADFLVSSAGALTITPSGNSLLLGGTTNFGSSVSRITKGWFTDLNSNDLTVDDLNLNGSVLSSIANHLEIIPVAGKMVLLDGHWGFDANVLRGITANDSEIIPYTGTEVLLDGHWAIKSGYIRGATDINSVFTAYAGKSIVIEDVYFDGGVIGATGTRVTKGWFTDLEITNVQSIGGHNQLRTDFVMDATVLVSDIVGVASFSGSGLNDLTTSGTYVGTTDKSYKVFIYSTGATDTFKWSDDDGVTWSSAIYITGSAQSLSDGVEITFAATTGHTSSDSWSFFGGATTSCQITVDGDTDTRYRISINLTHCAGIGVVYFRFNTDSGANYWGGYNSNAIVTPQNQIRVFKMDYNSMTGFFEGTLYAKSGFKRKLLGATMHEAAGAYTSILSSDCNAAWTNIADNITSIDIGVTGTATIGVGTNIKVWVMR